MRLKSSDTIARLEWTIRVFRERFGVEVPGSSRLHNALRLMKELQSGALKVSQGDESLLRRLQDAQLTAWQFFVIANAIGRDPRRLDTVFTQEKLATAFAGADVETDDKNPLARNTQFELYVASIFALAGTDVAGGEPDLRVLFWGEQAGIACKRMNTTNPDKLDERAKEAVRQIKDNAPFGFVAVNADILYRGEGLPKSEGEKLELFALKAKEVFDGMAKRIGPARHVRGVLIFGAVFEWRFEGGLPEINGSFPMTVHAITDEGDHEFERQAGEFFDGVFARWANSLEALS